VVVAAATGGTGITVVVGGAVSLTRTGSDGTVGAVATPAREPGARGVESRPEELSPKAIATRSVTTSTMALPGSRLRTTRRQ
jgi:hypothetical protein